ncbi:hypothetical protein EXIGLDRAFT_726050 [Exidia glandulosa HHB12029]|uniref:Uncharacterized protein n=1 Tax=Exidia glandulosa HHB12029 TaxID=1314781 RepID=A0A165DWS0_EXIGL|nr:hypothetical protein EXIGLDRAFT_726050 [Exidia glandulosa HHB12029]
MRAGREYHPWGKKEKSKCSCSLVDKHGSTCPYNATVLHEHTICLRGGEELRCPGQT